MRRLGEERDERNKGEKNGRVGGGEWSRIIIVFSNYSTFHECELVLEKSSDLLSPHVMNCNIARLCERGREDSMKCRKIQTGRQTDRQTDK